MGRPTKWNAMNMAKHLSILIASALLCDTGFAASPQVPKTWDDAEMRKLELPLADPAVSREHAPADYYYRIPVRAIFKSYPVYHPDKEPPGSFEELHKRKPELLWDDKGARPCLPRCCFPCRWLRLPLPRRKPTRSGRSTATPHTQESRGCGRKALLRKTPECAVVSIRVAILSKIGENDVAPAAH
jgi:hypothetical protein